MTNKFSCFLTQKGRWLTATLFLLFSLGIGNAWGADKSATTSLNLSNLISSNWGSWSDGTPIISGDYFKISAYMGRTSSSQSWIGYTGGNNGDYNSGWSSTGKFAGSDALNATSKYMAMQPSRSMYFRVTGCKAVYALVQNTKSGATYRRTTISAFEYTTSRAASASATMTSSDNSTTVEEISVTGLDATKTYEILLAGTESNNAYLMELVFEKSSSTLNPSATPTISAHPSTSAAQYIKDATATALSVTATSSAGTLSYQWYSNTTASNASGSAIEGATSASYTPSTAAAGTLYYYCAVTNTESGKSATTVKSNVSGAISVILNPVGSGHVLTWNLTVRESSSGESTLGTATTDIGTASKNSTSTYITNLTDLTGVGVKRTTDGKSNNTGKIETPASYDADKYVSYSFDVASGYTFTPSAVSIKTVAVSTAKHLKFEFNDANGSYSVTKTNLSTSGTAATNNLDFSECDVNFTGTVTVKMYVYGATDLYRLSTPLTITGTVAEAGACEPPTNPSVTSTNWIYVPGETINLTASATGTTASTTYTWYKGADLATAKAAGAIQAAKTSAQGGTTYSCTASDAYRYWCVIRNGTCEASASYDIKIYKFYLYDNSGSDVSNAAFATIDREDNKISVDVALANAAYTYKFKVTDGFGTWYGKNESTITSSTNWLDGLVADEANVGLTSTGAGSYTIDYYYNVNNVVVTYPTAYTITHSAATNGTYTIKVGDADATDGNTTANYGQTIVLAATPEDGYLFSAWTVMNGETPVEVTNNSFTMPAGNVTVSATFVEAPTPCYTYTAPLDQTTVFHVGDVIPGSTGGQLTVYSEATNSDSSLKNSIKFDNANGLKLGGGAADRVQVTLSNLMQVGTVISVAVTSGSNSNPDGLYLKNESNGNVKDSGNQNVLFGWSTAPEQGTQATFTYTVRASDGLDGKNVFILERKNTMYIRSMSVSECGAELHALTSAIDPVHDPAYATVTLNKTLVATGATATATYSAIDAAYDFDEWQISGATIDDAKANPVTITMGSTDATITLKLKAAAVKHTVTYYDGEAIPANKLDDELIVEGNHPTGAGLAPRKLGYTFAGWSTSNGGAVVALNTISVDADMPLFAVWNAIDCASKTGTIYTMEIAVAPAANCTIKTASGFESTWDLYQYEGIVGGEAMIGNTGGSNSCILQTNKTVLLKDNVSYMKLDFDCPLKEGDTIKTNVTGSGKAAYISTADTRPEESAALAIISNSTTGKLIVPAALNNATSVYLWKGGGNVTITSIEIVRPVKHSVTFNMNGHGDAIDPEYVVDGAKATEPDPAPTASGYRFVEWQLSGSAYDFDDAVTTDIELDAVWQKTWTVTFNSNGGSDVAATTVDDGQAVAQPANPTKSGFDFVEWQLNSATYNFALAVEANITLVATWEVAQDDASLSALSYNGNAIDVNSAVDVSGVQTYTVHLPWGSTIDAALISVTKSAESASLSSITYNNEEKQATFQVTSGNGLVSVNYAIQFVIDAKRGTSIIKATTNNVITGLIGGTRDTNLGDGNTKKLNKGNYFGVTLANDETFQEGDVFIVNITSPADLGKFMIYADKNRTELVADQGIVYTKPNVASPVVCPTGEMMLVLPAAANGKKSLYLSRENVDNSEQWNVTFSYIEVTREMNPAIKSFKFGDEAATINESAKTITYEVAYGTAVTALTPTVEAYGNNGATYTPAGATDFTSPVVYTVTDAYNELHTDYTVTVNIAAPSTNAYLASLSVAGYVLDFDKEVETYNIVLDYGTTVLPEITYAVEDAGLATAVKVEGDVNGATTITVTPQAGAGYEKVYTINFSVNTTPTFKVFDGRTMNAAIVSFTDPTSGMTWTSEDATTSSSSNTKTINGKTYTKSVKIFGSATSASRYLKFTVPADYVAKFYLAGSTNSSTGEATLFFSKELTADPAKAIAGLTASVDDPKWAQTDYQLPGDYYFCVTGSARIYELSVTLYPIDEERAMTQGRFGTICYPNGGRLLGAMLLEIAYFDPDQKKIFFDEVIGGQMVAGAPYLFLPNEGVDKFAIVYTDNVNALAGHHNGLYGSYTQEALPTDGNHYIMLNNQYCKVVEANTYVGANRAYIQLDKIGNDYVAPSYGRRRVSLGVQQAEVATGLEDLNVGDQPIKIMINGQMYILRGEKMYDATGRLVK